MMAYSALKWSTPGRSLLLLTLVLAMTSSAAAQYFVINQPGPSTSWANGSPYPLQWVKGRQDGINSFDVEITRLSEDGLYLVAQNVPATYSTLNILMEDVPEGNDYFVVCLNSTSSTIYAVSSRFSVTNSSSAQNPSPDSSVPTVTISSSPSPTASFASTLGPPISAARSLLFNPRSSSSPVFGFEVVLVLFAVFLGGAMTLW